MFSLAHHPKWPRPRSMAWDPLLLAETCNMGFEPLIRRDNPALRRSRLSWVRQSYIRAETLTRSNAILTIGPKLHSGKHWMSINPVNWVRVFQSGNREAMRFHIWMVSNE